jgi:tryptophanyl-tRNA synthetase
MISCVPVSSRRATSQALERAHALLDEVQNLSHGDRERLFGFLEGDQQDDPGRAWRAAHRGFAHARASMARRCPSPTTTPSRCVRDADSVTKKIRTMQTDPARVGAPMPGDPDKCPVWQFHQVYSDESTKQWVQQGCRSAGIGCIECKQPVIDAVSEGAGADARTCPGLHRRSHLVRNIIADGCEKARKLASRDHARRARGDRPELQHVTEIAHIEAEPACRRNREHASARERHCYACE